MIRKYHKQILSVLENLHKNHPNYNLGRHISTALDGSDIWSISDKDFLQALKDYQSELDSDITHEDDVEQIIKQGMNLNNIVEDEEWL